MDSLLAESDSLRFFLLEKIQRQEGEDLSVGEVVEAYAAFCPERAGGRCRLQKFILRLKD